MQSREITLCVQYVKAILFAKTSGGAFARSWLQPCSHFILLHYNTVLLLFLGTVYVFFH